jgi:hypothetical protein
MERERDEMRKKVIYKINAHSMTKTSKNGGGMTREFSSVSDLMTLGVTGIPQMDVRCGQEGHESC